MRTSGNDIVRVGICNESDERFQLTEGKMYIILGESEDLIDGDAYVYVKNDANETVNVKKDRFFNIRNVRRQELSSK